MKKQTILFLAANPSTMDRTALDREARAIQVELELTGDGQRFNFETRWAAEPLDLLRHLRKLKPTIVHYAGHGDRSGLFFQSPDGRPALISTAAIAETFGAAGASVRLVVLNACYGEAQAEALCGHIDCVIGMAGVVRDETARNFAIGLYGAIGERESIATAYRHGCAAMSLTDGSAGLGGSDSTTRDLESSDTHSYAARPQLKVRDGVNAESQILAMDPPSPRTYRRYLRG